LVIAIVLNNIDYRGVKRWNARWLRYSGGCFSDKKLCFISPVRKVFT